MEPRLNVRLGRTIKSLYGGDRVPMRFRPSSWQCFNGHGADALVALLRGNTLDVSWSPQRCTESHDALLLIMPGRYANRLAPTLSM